MKIDLLENISLTEKTNIWPKEQLSEMARDIKVIYSDVDGTLLGPGGCLFKDARHNPTSLPALAILQCHIHNVDVVLVSGRNSKQLNSDSRILGFKNWIAELGCLIVYNRGEVVLLNVGDYISPEKTVWEAIRDSGAPDMLLNNFSNRLEYHEPWSNDRECTHLFRGLIDIDLANQLLEKNGFGQLKIIDNGRVKRRSEKLSHLPDVHAYHLLPKASGKASAVRKDMQTRGIAKHQAIAIGDSVADLELASEVGAVFIVKNAVTTSPEIIEKIGKYPNVFITREEMGLGWAEVINYMLGRWL